MNIEKILTTLVNGYQVTREEPEKVPEINIDIPKRNFDSSGFVNFFSCITDNDEELNTIKTNLEKYEYVDTLNKKKVIMSIERNEINNTTKLFLAMHFNINIYEYHEKSKILKVYYPEEYLYTSKESRLIFYDHDNSSYSVATEDNITHEYIMENLPNILTVAIGLTIDKKYSVSNVYQAYDFIIGEVKNDDWINEENIVNRRPILELPVYDNFDWRTFDTKTFIESFDKNKLLTAINCLLLLKACTLIPLGIFVPGIWR